MKPDACHTIIYPDKSGGNMLARWWTFGLIIALWWGGALFASSAYAQGQERKVIRLEAIRVEGRVQKPQAFYILQRSNLNFEGLELQHSFLPKIIKSVEQQPF